MALIGVASSQATNTPWPLGKPTITGTGALWITTSKASTASTRIGRPVSSRKAAQARMSGARPWAAAGTMASSGPGASGRRSRRWAASNMAAERVDIDQPGLQARGGDAGQDLGDRPGPRRRRRRRDARPGRSARRHGLGAVGENTDGDGTAEAGGQALPPGRDHGRRREGLRRRRRNRSALEGARDFTISGFDDRSGEDASGRMGQTLPRMTGRPIAAHLWLSNRIRSIPRPNAARGRGQKSLRAMR
jgi:hypothetical protein